MTTQEAPAAAEIAHAMSECMNLLFLFAAPRVLESVRGNGPLGLDAPTALGSLRRFLRHANGIRARADMRSGVSGDVERLVQSAMIVEEIAGALGALGPSPFDAPLPAPVVERARRSLGILGMPEPAGGWDAFEGFSVPSPPPSPRG